MEYNELKAMVREGGTDGEKILVRQQGVGC